MLETLIKLCMTARFLEKLFTPKIRETGKKIVFFNLKKKLVINLLNLFYSENAYYLRCSCTNPIFGKDLVPEI